MQTIMSLFHADQLSLIMTTLVCFVGVCVASFSARYLKGDRNQGEFYRKLLALLTAVLLMVNADHLLLFLSAWGASNVFLVQLMRHKGAWKAAQRSAWLAAKVLMLSTFILSINFFLLFSFTGHTSIQAIIHTPPAGNWGLGVGVLLCLSAMMQSALWPFHRWLISSLNSPTPVSAMMHAGLINGGGFLLVRFSPILLSQPALLQLLFCLGFCTAIMGTLWKLMQSDIKRMLACSTMGQMGFMVAQCGLGLFPAAVAHLCWHGVFKAYLFLSSGGAGKEKRLDTAAPSSVYDFLAAVCCGISGAWTFCWLANKSFFAQDTTIVVVFLATIAGTQFSFTLLQSKMLLRIPVALFATALASGAYGASLSLVEDALPSALLSPQPFTLVHLAALSILTLAWLGMLWGRCSRRTAYPSWMLKGYVYMLNACQPHRKTVTPDHNTYHY